VGSLYFPWWLCQVLILPQSGVTIWPSNETLCGLFGVSMVVMFSSHSILPQYVIIDVIISILSLMLASHSIYFPIFTHAMAMNSLSKPQPWYKDGKNLHLNTYPDNLHLNNTPNFYQRILQKDLLDFPLNPLVTNKVS
jgi:hypothetical protein